jgi:hypothetical protein
MQARMSSALQALATSLTAGVHPSLSVTLTPAGKESDPNALALLLRSEHNGRLNLMFAYQFPWEGITFNGYRASCFTIDGGPHADSLYFSMGGVLPKSD